VTARDRRRAIDVGRRQLRPETVGRKPLVRTGPDFTDGPFRRRVTAKRPRLGPID
jgi:hypothetical protein